MLFRLRVDSESGGSTSYLVNAENEVAACNTLRDAGFADTNDKIHSNDPQPIPDMTHSNVFHVSDLPNPMSTPDQDGWWTVWLADRDPFLANVTTDRHTGVRWYRPVGMTKHRVIDAPAGATWIRQSRP